MTTEFENFSISIVTTDEGKVQPTLTVTDSIERFNEKFIKLAVDEFDNLNKALKAKKYEISNKLVHSEVERMKDWTKVYVKSTDTDALIKELAKLKKDNPV
jgi:hypothetical protein